MRSKLTEERAAVVAQLVAEGLTLDPVAERLGVHRRTTRFRRVMGAVLLAGRYPQMPSEGGSE